MGEAQALLTFAQRDPRRRAGDIASAVALITRSYRIAMSVKPPRGETWNRNVGGAWRRMCEALERLAHQLQDTNRRVVPVLVDPADDQIAEQALTTIVNLLAIYLAQIEGVLLLLDDQETGIPEADPPGGAAA